MAESESAQTYLRLEDAARRRALGKAELWRDADLKVARKWRKKENPTPEWAARYGGDFDAALEFLDESEAAESERLRREKDARQRELREAQARVLRFRRFSGGLALLAVFAFGGGMYAWIQKRIAQEARD